MLRKRRQDDELICRHAALYKARIGDPMKGQEALRKPIASSWPAADSGSAASFNLSVDLVVKAAPLVKREKFADSPSLPDATLTQQLLSRERLDVDWLRIGRFGRGLYRSRSVAVAQSMKQNATDATRTVRLSRSEHLPIVNSAGR